jgi:hypothetical protein
MKVCKHCELEKPAQGFGRTLVAAMGCRLGVRSATGRRSGIGARGIVSGRTRLIVSGTESRGMRCCAWSGTRIWRVCDASGRLPDARTARRGHASLDELPNAFRVDRRLALDLIAPVMWLFGAVPREPKPGFQSLSTSALLALAAFLARVKLSGSIVIGAAFACYAGSCSSSVLGYERRRLDVGDRSE